MSSQNNQHKPIIQSSQAKQSLTDNRLNENNKVYKKSLSFQDTDNMTYLDASNIQDYLNNPANGQIPKTSVDRLTSNTNYDRDDSLNDVISFGKQTPFRFDNSNMNSFDADPRINFAASRDQQDNNNNNMSILNLRDTTIDEMFLLNDNNANHQKFLKLDTTPNKKHSLRAADDFFNRINLNPEFELSFNIDNNTSDSKFLQSTTRNTQPDQSLFSLSPKVTRNTGGGGVSPSRIPVRSRTNLNESNVKILQELQKDSLENDEFEPNKPNNEKSKMNGAFKLFVSGTNLNKLTSSEVSFTRKEQELAECSEMGSNKPDSKSPTYKSTFKKNASNSTRSLDKKITKLPKSAATTPVSAFLTHRIVAPIR